MYRATTTPDIFTLPLNADACSVIRVAYAQGGELVLMKKYENGVADSGMELEGKTVTVTLTQEEANLFKKGRASTQLRALITATGKAATSDEFEFTVKRVLDDEIMR